jgi:putative transposase
VKGHRAAYGIATMCRTLGVSTSGYYAWQYRAPSGRAQSDAELTMTIHTIHLESRGTYGAPRVHAELAAQGIRVGRKRVARLMRAARVQGVSRRKWVTTTTRDPEARPAPDLVQRDFTVDGPDRLWVADITYVPTGAGFLYLAVVLDAWSRRVVGWAMATHLRTELVLAALDMALEQRRPHGVIHHSDHGCQYTAIAYGQRCLAFGVRPSMGSVGDAYDNALCESFFATVECERLDRERFRTPAEARRALFDFIEGWYNPHRRHSALDYESPLRYEQLHAAETLRRTTPETSAAVLPRQATIAQGGAISLSPQTRPTAGPTNRGRA